MSPACWALTESGRRFVTFSTLGSKERTVVEPMTGRQFGSYRIQHELGRGGMGVVYCANETALDRLVALKLLAPHLLDDAAARTRFQYEIRSSVAIEHPHVVPVYSAGYEEGHFFIAMRYVRGPDLLNVLERDGPL